MQLITCHGGRLLTLNAAGADVNALRTARRGALPAAAQQTDSFATGLAALDALPPGGAFARGVVHELLCDPADGTPLFVAMILASRSTGILPVSETQGSFRHGQDARATSVIWCDPGSQLYPPALAAHGMPLDRLFLLRPRSAAEQTWAVAECLRCKGVAAVVAPVGYPLSRVEARRLQLSAERGGGIGLLLRPPGKVSSEHAAATRWLVRPAPGERGVQRWSVRLVHGHGGRVGEAVILEYSRETNSVRAVEQLAGRPGEKEVAVRAAGRESRTAMRHSA